MPSVFLTITESFNLHIVKRSNISSLKNAFPAKFAGLEIIPTTET
jgi:hypothetical protein